MHLAVWDEAGDSGGSSGGRNRGKEAGAYGWPTPVGLWENAVTPAGTPLATCAVRTRSRDPSLQIPGKARGGREWAVTPAPEGAGRGGSGRSPAGLGGRSGRSAGLEGGGEQEEREDPRAGQGGARGGRTPGLEAGGGAGSGRNPARVREEGGASGRRRWGAGREGTLVTSPVGGFLSWPGPAFLLQTARIPKCPLTRTLRRSSLQTPLFLMKPDCRHENTL